MIWVRRRRRVLCVSAVLLLLLAGGCAILTLPLTTLQGVDYRVAAHRMPAYVKAIDFLQRHYQYQLLVSRICAGKTSDAACVLAIFDWTHRSVPATPDGWPVVDDHPLHIVIRGHGKNDQIADVFTTLTVYAGIPAFFRFITEPSQKKLLVLAFARLDGKWTPFDVENNIVFRNSDGQLADVADLVDNPALVEAQAAGRLAGGLPYSRFISKRTLMPFNVPDPLRAELQQPWPRLHYELRRVIGLESD